MPTVLLSSLIILLLSTISAADALSCFVMRPGFGLISEECPSSAIGCRIKTNGNLIEWYEWAKLYDRSQLVCVYPGEYSTPSGCVKKPSGSVRCWCGGHNCNDAESSVVIAQQGKAPTTTTTSTTHGYRYQGNNVEDSGPLRIEPLTRMPAGRAKATRKEVHKITKATTTTSTSTSTSTTTTTTRPTTTTTVPTTTKPRVKVTWAKKHTTTSTTTLSPTSVQVALSPIRNKNDGIASPEESAFTNTVFEETRRKLEEEIREEDERFKEEMRTEELELDSDEEGDEIEDQPVPGRRFGERREEDENEDDALPEEDEKRLEKMEQDEVELERRGQMRKLEEEEDYGWSTQTKQKRDNSKTTPTMFFAAITTLLVVSLLL